MADREKIIKGIQECDLNGGLIGNCPYKGILLLLKEQEAKAKWVYCEDEYGQDGYKCSECGFFVSKDALAVLKEQEAVRPERQHSGGGTTWWNVCGNCRTAINPNDKYCYECGRRIKWDDNRA